MSATYTHATDNGPSCCNCESVAGEGIYQYRHISDAVWEARCVECHDVDRFHTWSANVYRGLAADASVASVRTAHTLVDRVPCETLHYR